MFHLNICKKKLLLGLIISFFVGKALGQKGDPGLSVIDTGAVAHWEQAVDCRISPLGGYIMYWKEDIRRSVRLVVMDTGRRWSREYPPGWFFLGFCGNDSDVVLLEKERLHFIRLGQGEDRQIANARWRFPRLGLGVWLAYQEKGDGGTVVLVDMETGQEFRLGPGEPVDFSPRGNCLLTSVRQREDSGWSQELRLVQTSDRSVRSVWRGRQGEQLQMGEVSFDQAEQGFSFVVTKKEGDRTSRAIWHYRPGEERATELIADGDSRLPAGMHLSGHPQLSGPGRWLFFGLEGEQEVLPKPVPGLVRVDIWSYTDRVVQPEQVARGEKPPTAMAVIGVDGRHLQILSRGEEQTETVGWLVNGDAVVVSQPDTSKWEPIGGAFNYPREYRVVSLLDGSRRWLKRGVTKLDHFRFSPDGKWLVYYNQDKKQYYSYEFGTEIEREISGGLSQGVNRRYGLNSYRVAISPPLGWWDGRVLLYDRYDLWAVDPGNRRPAINITRGFGTAHRLELRLWATSLPEEAKEEYHTGDTLLLSGFGEVSKENGFLRQVLGSGTVPAVLTLQPCLYYQTVTQLPNNNFFDLGMRPEKARQAAVWVVKRQTASEAPNFYVSPDLVHYRKITDEQPQQGYRWLTAELVNWRQLDGTPGQGILYKPQDFDPNKRYPVIVHYYEQVTHRVYEFPEPGLTTGSMNIPWFVSRGYLVFTPDIHRETSVPSNKTAGEWAYNAVVSGVEYLKKLPYVDGRHIGTQGHSFGALETNYLVAHTHLFTAASEFSGPTDIVSLSLSLGGTQSDFDFQQGFAEAGQLRMGATLWQRPDLYQRLSAVLQADQVTTPLLMVHNKKDGTVPWHQGVEWYLALRRLHKRAWMLQYDDGDHSNGGWPEALDYTLRLEQFFGYYLKGEPPPIWMTKGVPAKLKGRDSGLEIDNSGKAVSEKNNISTKQWIK